MRRMKSRLCSIIMGAGLALCAAAAHATQLQDLVRFKGHERNIFTGLGIVVGLPGTGDTSKDALVVAQPYAKLLETLGSQVTRLEELDETDSFAIVNVTLDLPPTGAREGDRFNVAVSTLFDAESIAGGRLVISPLYVPGPNMMERAPFALASGPIIIEGINPRSGVIRDGGQMLADVLTNPVSPHGVVELVLEEQYKGFPVQSAIADAINSDPTITRSIDVARALNDAQTIRVLLPEEERSDPAPFLASLMTMPIDPSLLQTPARVVINEAEGTITVTGDVTIGAVAITHRGLSITSITPELPPSPVAPKVETSRWAGLDTVQSSQRATTNLANLIEAFKQLNVPVEDQIAIVHQLKKTGVLYAKIIIE